MEEKVQAKQVGPKYNLLGKGWTKIQPDGGKGSSEAGWAKIQPFRKKLGQNSWYIR